ncbi:hypothetical protein C5E06_10070 [Pseudoclavibacter sp. RFBI5]|uniref:hypothetical protein n=1 Tax=Pseudoclavibacter sp. RFBI5 TaxID=2080578 RepID=UPI000CE937F7|nr:hypothetical protein [Pseudoclavibacter sp. RFBI5]PPG02787.1 hypothetical protein C5E06_10070 [Pseudoclavibacter sp. RFBI5]
MTISNEAAQRREASRSNGTTGGQFGHQQHTAPAPGQFAAVPTASTRAAEHRYDAAVNQLRALDNIGEIADPARKAELTREAIAAAAAVHYPTADRVALTYDNDGGSYSQFDRIMDANGDIIAQGPEYDIDEDSIEFNAKVADATSYHGIPLEGTYDLTWLPNEYDERKTMPTREQVHRFAANRARAARVREAEDAETRAMAGRLVKDALPTAARIHFYEDGLIRSVEDSSGAEIWDDESAKLEGDVDRRMVDANSLLRTFESDGREEEREPMAL